MKHVFKNQIAIDGPAASGKSSVAKAVAKKIGWNFLSSGKIYRSIAATYWQINKGELAKINAPLALENFVKKIHIDCVDEEILINQKKNDLIFDERINPTLGLVAANKLVRQVVNAWLRNYTENINIVVEGRDIGSKVLPDAFLKFYLDADLKIRARRRYDQQKNKASVTLTSIENELAKRDQSDRDRQVNPLVIAHDAICIDTSHLSFEEVVNQLVKIFGEKYYV